VDSQWLECGEPIRLQWRDRAGFPPDFPAADRYSRQSIHPAWRAAARFYWRREVTIVIPATTPAAHSEIVTAATVAVV
jgi:hypothetical protein